jgi:hypothetical protein
VKLDVDAAHPKAFLLEASNEMAAYEPAGPAY